MVAAVKQNYPQREIADAAFELQAEIDARPADRRRRQRVHARATSARCELHRIDPALERKQIDARAGRARPPRRRGGRGHARPRSSRRPRTSDANLMPALLDAARAHATEGEIVEALQEVFGSYTETPVF